MNFNASFPERDPCLPSTVMVPAAEMLQNPRETAAVWTGEGRDNSLLTAQVEYRFFRLNSRQLPGIGEMDAA